MKTAEFGKVMTLKELKSLKAEPGRKILVIGSFYWGVGDTGDEAHKNAKRISGWLVYDVLEGTWVDGTGALRIDGKDNPDRLPHEEVFKLIGNKPLPKGT